MSSNNPTIITHNLWKAVIGIVVLIFVTLLITFMLLYGVYAIPAVVYISSFAIQEPSIQLSILVFMLLSISLLIKWHKKITKWIIFLCLLIGAFVCYTANVYLIEKRIFTIAIKKYGVEPSYLNIDFDINAEYKTPHAVIHKDRKSYYWSFEKNDFVLNTNPNLYL